MLALVVGFDVDGIGAGLLDSLDLDGLAVAARHTVALAFGCLDDEVETPVVGKGLVQRKGERRVGADDVGGRRSLLSGEASSWCLSITV